MKRLLSILLTVWIVAAISVSYAGGPVDSSEQKFVDFLSRLSDADPDSLQKEVNVFLDEANADEQTYSAAYRLAGKYLNSFDSATRNEDLYILFLQHAVEKGHLGEADKERARFRLEMAMKNRPGMTAPDFRLVTRSGEKTTFRSLLQDGRNIILFYDPDCGHCAEVIALLEEEPVFQNANVVAIDAEEDRDYWEKTAESLPPSWRVAFALDDIQEEELYIFSEMPTIYLTDGDATIILKEPTIAALLKRM